MKTFLPFLLLSIMTFESMQSQISLQHSFDDQASIAVQLVQLDVSGKKYVLVNKLDSITYEFAFFSSDFSPYKTISLNLESLFVSSYYRDPQLQISFIAEKLFDSDSDVDLLGELSYLDSNDELYAQVIIFHENGSTLFASDIDNSNAWLVSQSIANAPSAASLVSTPTGTKMILDVYYFKDGVYTYDVYNIPGNIPSYSDALKSEEEGMLEAFPNPAGNYLNLHYRLPADQSVGVIELTDNLGRNIKSLHINQRQGIIRVNVSDLKNGLYYTKVGSKRGLPRSRAIVIER